MSLRKQATSSLIWTFSQQFGNQIISFVVSIILARLLLPEEFGLIGMIIVFIAIGKSLMDAGLTQSLIRDKEVDQEDLSTVFYFNLVASILIYFLIFITAPFIADFYDQEILTGILRMLCLTFVISSFGAVQSTRLTKIMDFKTQTLISLPSIILSGVLGIVLAYMGYGVWSLVWSRIADTFFRTLQLWIYSKWTPDLVFNVSKFKDHFNFGYKLTLSSLLDTIFSNAYPIVIGKFFSAAQVGFYTRAESTKKLPVSNISNALNKVTYPLFAGIQNDNIRLKRVYRLLMQMVVFVIAPVLVFLGVLAEPIFRFLFTEKWLPAVPYFQILCITGILLPIHSYNLNVLKVKGRSDLFLKLALIKKGITIVGIAIAVNFDIYALLYTQVIISVISFYINAYYTDKFIDYSAWDQVKDISGLIANSLICGIVILILDHYLFQNSPDILRILLGGGIGAILYLGASHLFKIESLLELRKLIFKKNEIKAS